MKDLRTIVAFALTHYAEVTGVAPLVEGISSMRPERSGPRVPKKRQQPAQIVLDVPGGMVSNLSGPKESRDLFLLVRIPREVADRASGESPIVLPASAVPGAMVGRRSSLVMP